MAVDMGTAKGYLEIDISDFVSGMEKARREADNTAKATEKSFSDKMTSAGKTLESAGSTMTRAFTVPIGAAAAAGLKVGSDFEAGMSQVAGVLQITDKTSSEFQRLRDTAIDLGAKTAFSSGEVADAMTEMAKAGWNSSQIIDGMGGVLDAAAASGEGLSTVATICADAVTGFGLEAKDSTRIADLLAHAANAGTIDIKDLGETFKYVAPMAQSMGLSIEDVTTATTAMSMAGIKGSQAGTSLRRMLTNLVKPSDQVAQAMDELGIKITNEDGSFKSLDEIVGILRKSFSGLTDEQKAYYAATIAGANGQSGMLALLNLSEEEYSQLSEEMKNCGGEAKRTAEIMQDNLKSKVEQLGGALESLAIRLGDLVIPWLTKFVEKLTNVVEWLTNLPAPVQQAILIFAGLLAAIGPVLIIIGKLVTAIGTISKAIGALKAGEGILGGLLTGFKSMGGITGILGTVKGAITGFGSTISTMFGLMAEGNGIVASLTAAFPGLEGALTVLTGPIGIVIAIVGTLVAAFMHLWNTNEEFRNKITEIWNTIVEKFQGVFSRIGEILGSLGGLFEQFISLIGPLWDGFCQLLAPVFIGAFELIGSVLGGLLDVISGILDVFIGLFTGDWERCWQGVQEIFGGVWEAISGTFQAVCDMLMGIANVILGWFGTDWNTMWQGIGDFFTGLWQGIVDFFTGLWEGVVTFFTGAWETISGIVQTAWDTICNIINVAFQLIAEIFNIGFTIITLPFQFIWENCKGIVETAWNAIQGFIQTAMDTINNIIQTVWNAIWGFLGPILETIKNGVKGAWDWISSTTSNIWNGIKSTIGTIWDGIKTNVGNALNTVKTNVGNAWNNVKSTTSTIWNNTKSTLGSIWDNIKSNVHSKAETIKSNVSTAWNNIKSTTSSVFNACKSTAISIFDGIRSGIQSKIDAAKNVVRSGLDAISNFFRNAHFQLPHIKLPHFSISGHFSLDPPSIPHISVSWYRKAMENAMILDSPTIFGLSKGGGLLGGGEAGREVIAGADTLMQMIQDAIQSVGGAGPTAVGAGGGGDIIIPVYIGQETIDTIVVRANERNNYRNGGR